MKESRFLYEPLPKLEFDKRRSRVECCPCGKSNKDGKFVPYIGYKQKGYCHSCGETFLPELPKNESLQYPGNRNWYARVQPKPCSTISSSVLRQSLAHYRNNHLVQFLHGRFGTENTNELIKRYFIGTSTHWDAASVFWQIDLDGKVRTGKIMLYDRDTGKRKKEPFNYFFWVHKTVNQPDFVLQQCLFGEHLLKDRSKRVAIVESEKTAIIASLYFPQFTWLSTGGKDGLVKQRLSVLQGRSVTLFPDTNAYELWSRKARELASITKFRVSDLLERKATDEEREAGLDIADYLLQFEPPQRISPSAPINPQEETLQEGVFEKVEEEINLNWEVEKLKVYFEQIDLPTQPVRLDSCTTIINLSKFVKCHLAMIQANDNNKTFQPYHDRLEALKELLTINLN